MRSLARGICCAPISTATACCPGPNLDLYAYLSAIAPRLDVIASGGVRDVADVGALRASGVAGVVLGRSLLEGSLTLAEALAC